ncbi:baseplate component [Erwinia phage phiEt88]|uniref:baseplate component n=1 Tax=Erwinia phage phiEt88 TaxID=925984 RepID=UPI0001F1FC68|nr:baseplate component [Erwinia phage phiEt88]CBX44535.1 baseplate component [Erwinia phage phiEt88]
MADYITSTGFDKPTLPEIVQKIGDAMETVIGPINREADSATGQWIGIEAEQSAIHFETAEAVWASRFLASAERFALDALGDWMSGITRHGKTYTRVNSVLYGDESRLVPAGTLASFGNNQFRLPADYSISRSNLLDGEIRVNSATLSSYTVRIAGSDSVYTKKDGDTTSSIAAAISVLVNATSQYSSTSNGSVIRITSKNLIAGYSVSLSEGLTWQRIGSPGIFDAVDSGPIVVPVGGLNNPVSAIAGWSGVNNLVQGATGSDIESDTDYRKRLYQSRSSSGGAATVPAIETRLITEVSGVTLAKVIENDRMQAVNGIPEKAIHTIVSGGLEQDIANAIWKYKGAGIETFGDIEIAAYDRHKRPHIVKFSRPMQVEIRVKVDVVLLDTEEQLPAAVVEAIQQGVVNYGSNLGLGDDVITQRIYGYIYSNTTGIGKMTITVSTDGASYTEDNVSIPENSYAHFSISNVEVSGV